MPNKINTPTTRIALMLLVAFLALCLFAYKYGDGNLVVTAAGLMYWGFFWGILLLHWPPFWFGIIFLILAWIAFRFVVERVHAK